MRRREKNDPPSEIRVHILEHVPDFLITLLFVGAVGLVRVWAVLYGHTMGTQPPLFLLFRLGETSRPLQYILNG